VKQFEFSKARTALKYGIMQLGACQGSIILVPDFICNVVWHPLQQLGLNIKPYPVHDNLSPDWEELEKIQSLKPAWALLMVHYFGQPQNIDGYRHFCDHHRIKLIEDNAHGHGGKHYGKFLGTFGDMGISSPRKILNVSSGGFLFIPPESNVLANAAWRELPVDVKNIAESFKSLIRRSATIHGWLKSLRGINRDWSDPFLFQESEQADQLITPAASARLRSADWDQIAMQRRAAWQGWQEFCVANGLMPVFDAVDAESCPWAFPVYAKNLVVRNRWLAWGVRQGIPLFSWPALPNEVIQANGNSFARWQRMLCFPLEVKPMNFKGLDFES
jgi:hypothetical protein